MSTITTIEHLGDHVGQAVTLRGWIHHRTSKGRLHFVQLRDGSGFCQCVLFEKNVPAANDGYQDLLDDLLVADNEGADGFLQAAKGLHKALDGLPGFGSGVAG